MMLKVLLALMFIAPVYADINDLESLVKELEQKRIPMPTITLPKFERQSGDYKNSLPNNVFDASRNFTNYDLNSMEYNQDYSLNQLQMVGYMNYNGIDYAFLKTPFDTIKVKTGDQIKGAKIVNITNSVTEINQLQVIDDKTYNKKIYIELLQPTNSKAKLKQ